MIEVLMFDLGDTLVTGSPPTVIPGVPQALNDLRTLTTRTGAPLTWCIVSNFDELTWPATPHQVADAEQKYQNILRSVKLLQFFTPTERHVTLSTHVGVKKPDCRVFQAALCRLGLPHTSLTRCLLITEEVCQVDKVRSYGMKALLFDPENGTDANFSNWSQIRACIAELL
jgi:FMN phosphatase YigB (HAD superfamily)